MVTRRLYIALLALLALLPLAAAPRPTSAQAGSRCFAETGFCISGAIRGYWERNGGLAVFGYPISDQRVETVEGRTIPVQWFERDRLEIQADGAVTAGRLGARYLELTGRPWKTGPGYPDNPNCLYFPQTGYNLCGAFRGYWERNGGLERFGYPISPPVEEFIEGRSYPVQYFERRRMEYHPENAGTPYEVLLGLLGRDVRNIEVGGGCGTRIVALQPLDRAFRDQLGCPGAGARNGVPLATQSFERGMMVWVANEDVSGGKIFVIFNNDTSPSGLRWAVFDDTYVEGEPVNIGVTPPPGLFVPVRGFGKLWRDNDWVRGAVGFGTGPEQADRGAVQPYLDGRAQMIYRTLPNRALVLFPRGDSAGPAWDLPAQ